MVGLMSMAYGFFIEVCQIYIPYRTFGYDDLAADAVGVMAGLILFCMIRRGHKA